MKFPSDLHEMVEQLTFATKKLASLQEEVAKIAPLQEKVDQLRAKLLATLDKHGFTEEAIDLLLAAR